MVTWPCLKFPVNSQSREMKITGHMPSMQEYLKNEEMGKN